VIKLVRKNETIENITRRLNVVASSPRNKRINLRENLRIRDGINLVANSNNTNFPKHDFGRNIIPAKIFIQGGFVKIANKIRVVRS